MSWARYDDEFPMNRKVGSLIGKGQAGIAAIGAHVLLNTYSRHNGLAGRIEPHVPGLVCGGSVGKRLAKLLEEVGMLDAHPDGGWTIHDYAEFHDPNDPNPDRSAADRKKELSEKRAEAGRKGGQQKAANAGKQTASKARDLLDDLPGDLPADSASKSVANTQANVLQTPTPVPVPICRTLDTSSRRSHGSEDDDEAVDKYQAIVRCIGERRTSAKRPTPDNPQKYRATIERNLDTERGDEIRDLMSQYPDAPYDVIAAALEGEKRSLAHYERKDTA